MSRERAPLISDAQRRTLINLWCRVVRADGVVTDAELMRLSKLLHRLGNDLVSAAEVTRWLEHGPPDIDELLPRALESVFLEHAHTIILADQRVQKSEWLVVNELLATYFQKR